MNIRNRFLIICAATASFALSSCKDSGTSVNVSKPQIQIGQSITKDTLAGALKGTMVSGHTYYFSQDISVNAGDTLLIQSGVHLIAIPPADPTNSATPGPQISVYGTLVSLGTKDAQVWMTIPENLRTYDNLTGGFWGGIQGDVASGDIILKWTHIEYVGGPAGPGTPIAKAGSTRYGIWFQSINRNFILEDSWLRGTADDPIRVSGGHISVMRNTFEFGGAQGGDGLNIKSGTIGDVAYNLFIGDATNGPKLSNKGGAAVQTNVNIYNNTILNCGWRMVESGRAGSTNIEEGARGTEYNNLIVNCRTGFRLLGNPAADTINTFYDYQFYYAQVDSMRLEFYPAAGIQLPKPHDVAGLSKANDPQFVNYDVAAVGNFSQFNPIWPQALGSQSHLQNEQGTSNFHLKASSPCIGKGTTTPTASGVAVPLKTVPQGGDFGATSLPLGKDIGAYQADGTGNQH